MVQFDRRAFLKASLGTAAAAGMAGGLGVQTARAQGGSFKFKLGTDLPVAHPVNVRLREAIDAIAAETNGAVAITLFPNNQLGSDFGHDVPDPLRRARTRDVSRHRPFDPDPVHVSDRAGLCLHQL